MVARSEPPPASTRSAPVPKEGAGQVGNEDVPALGPQEQALVAAIVDQVAAKVEGSAERNRHHHDKRLQQQSAHGRRSVLGTLAFWSGLFAFPALPLKARYIEAGWVGLCEGARDLAATEGGGEAAAATVGALLAAGTAAGIKRASKRPSWAQYAGALTCLAVGFFGLEMPQKIEAVLQNATAAAGTDGKAVAIALVTGAVMLGTIAVTRRLSGQYSPQHYLGALLVGAAGFTICDLLPESLVQTAASWLITLFAVTEGIRGAFKPQGRPWRPGDHVAPDDGESRQRIESDERRRSGTPSNGAVGDAGTGRLRSLRNRLPSSASLAALLGRGRGGASDDRDSTPPPPAG